MLAACENRGAFKHAIGRDRCSLLLALRLSTMRGLAGSMSRRGNCHDNAVAESFFQHLKRERIKRNTYTTRKEARQDVFDYIEMFYNPRRRHSHANDLSPVEYEKQYFLRLGSV